MAVRINIENLNPKRTVNIDLLCLASRKVCALMEVSDAEINILLVSNQKIRAFNRRFLGKDRSTDVLAFPAPSRGKEKMRGTDRVWSSGDVFLGDIAISTDKAVSNADIYDEDPGKELLRYVVHGILHLLGVKDSSERERNRMREKEDELLQKTGRFFKWDGNRKR